MVELFAIRLPDREQSDQELEDLLAIVDESFREKVRRYRLQKDALRSLGGRLGILWYLKTRGLVALTSEAVFDVKGKGKPILAKPILQDPLDYNIAHDGDYVLLGVARGGRQIGVDLMAVQQDQLGDLEEALSDQMTVRERQMLAGLSSRADKHKALMTIWCAKEAYVKAIGEGLGFELNRVDVEINIRGEEEEGRGRVSIRVDGRDIATTGWGVFDGYLDGDGAAYRWVCVIQVEPAGSRTPVEPQTVSWQDIVSEFSA